MKIRLIGQRNTSGIGTHYSNFCDAILRRPGVGNLVEEVDFMSQEALVKASQDSADDDINISFVSVNLQDHFRGRNIQWIVFETTSPPEQLMDNLRPAHQVWVPSAWARDILLAKGLASEKLHVVHEGVDADRYYPRFGEVSTNPFVFLFVGKYEERKCLEETIQAFANTYGKDSSAELVVKTGYFKDDLDRTRRLYDYVNTLACDNIKVIYAGVDDTDLWNLYRGANAFVFPSRGEGWGLPLIEAAAMGVPLVTTVWSGQTEFLSSCKTSVVPVEFTLGDVHCEDHKKYYPAADGNFGQWAFPTVDGIAKAMEEVRNNYARYSVSARENSAVVREQFNWTGSVDQALVAISKLKQVKVD
jgi:glycosyltransferase involved in cell wall biosynthesis